MNRIWWCHVTWIDRSGKSHCIQQKARSPDEATGLAKAFARVDGWSPHDPSSVITEGSYR